VLLFDSLNLIKGFRYEIWALARQIGTRCCVVSLETGAETCRAWNAARPEEDRYEEKVMEDLVGRLERPDSMRRWESPLFSVYPERQSEEEVDALCEAVARYCIGADGNEGRDAGGGGRRPHQQPMAKVGDLTPAMSTAQKKLAPTNLLHDIDKDVQAAIKRIVDAQTLAGGAPAGIISFGPGMPILNATRPISMVELRRWKRMFVKMVTNTMFADGRPDQITALFVQYASEQIHGGSVDV
jgi:protein KTI12